MERQEPDPLWRMEDAIGLYPIPKGTPAFEKQVAPYVAGKGTVRLPLRDPIPHDIVRAMVTFRMKEIAGTSNVH